VILIVLISDSKTKNSRAYLCFGTPEALFAFVDRFNGHFFITNKGSEQKAVVEYAPFQKVPRASKKRVDPRENTIETDTDFLQFQEDLKKPIVYVPSAEEQLDKKLAEERELAATNGGILPPQISPLLEYLKLKKGTKVKLAKRGDRSERRKRAKERDRAKEKEKAPPKDEKKQQRRDRERGGKRRDREERRKKKKEGEKKDIEKAVTKDKDKEKDKGKADSSKTAEDDKRRNGIWMIRRHLEPGSITIQTRDQSSTTDGSSESPSSVSDVPIPSQRNGSQKSSRSQTATSNTAAGRKSSGRRPGNGNRTESKVYAPKVYAPKQPPVQSGNNA